MTPSAGIRTLLALIAVVVGFDALKVAQTITLLLIFAIVLLMFFRLLQLWLDKHLPSLAQPAAHRAAGLWGAWPWRLSGRLWRLDHRARGALLRRAAAAAARRPLGSSAGDRRSVYRCQPAKGIAAVRVGAVKAVVLKGYPRRQGV